MKDKYSHSDRFIIKRQRVYEALCCPNCHADLEYPSAYKFHQVPFAGGIMCPKCNQVGTVINGRFIFNSNKSRDVIKSTENYCGSIYQHNVPVSTNMLFPSNSWQEANGSYWSNIKDSRMVIQSNSLAVGVTLLKHPWSGFVKMLVDGTEVAELDLFERAGSMQQWFPIHLGDKSHIIEVIVTGKKNPLSHDCQVHVIGLEIIEKTNTVPPSYHCVSRNYGNEYPQQFNRLLNEIPVDGLALDCGSGDRNHPDPRVVSFEYSMFQGPDVFGDGHKLPFKDNSFDLVLSQAVIEHLYDPFTAVTEIFRVLKPGGVVYVESAFIQPLHAVPYHFFNTTSWGLEQLFKNFEIKQVTHEGNLSQTLEWFYRLTTLREKGLGAKVDQLLEVAKELDQHIDASELKYFSSYVTLLAKKPRELQ